MTFRTDTTDIGQLNYNKNSFLILLGQRNKYRSERTSTGKYKSTTKIASIKISTIKFQVKQD